MKTKKEIKDKTEVLKQQLVEVDASIANHKGNTTPRALNQVLDVRMQLIASIDCLEWVIEGVKKDKGV
jgi:TATA-binding protein-associated factor Taf7